MTVNSDLARVVYTGNGTTTVFSTGFAFQSNLDVRVILTVDATQVETTQIENTDFTLTGATHADDPPTAGTLTMVHAPAVGTHLTIMRDVQFVQDIDGTTLSTMDAGDQEEMYDKIWHALSQLKAAYARTLHASDGSLIDIPGSWVPIIAVYTDGARRVLQVTGWTGGPDGTTPPASGMFIGPTSYVSTAAAAVDIRGTPGNQGDTGPQGPPGPQGIPGPVGPGGSGSGDMVRANNLNDVISVSQSRTNLGLKNSATRDVGTIAGTVAAGDDSRFGAATAAATAFTPTGGVASTNVQAAIAEVDAEKATITYVDTQDAALNTAKVAKAGDTMTGPLVLPIAAPTLNTHAANKKYVDDTIAAAPPSTVLPLSKQVLAFVNQNSPSVSATHGPSQGTAMWMFLMKDGSIRQSGHGDGSTGWPSSRGMGSDINPRLTNDLRKVNMPVGLLGTPVAIYYSSVEAFVLTDQGDVAVAGNNVTGATGTGVAANTKVEVFTLLPATNIGPRSAGGASRKIVDIATTGNGNDSSGTNTSTYFRCADNTLWACGYNGLGQLAQGNTTQLLVPTQCLKNDGAGNVAVADCAKVYAGGMNNGSVGYIDGSGKVRLCGSLAVGAVGRNTATGSQNVFRPIFTTTDIAGSDLPAAYQAIDILIWRQDTVMIRCADKCLYAWGYNGQGQVGIANTTNQNNPKKVGGGTAVAAAFNGFVERVWQVSGRGDAAAFMCQMTDNSVYAWGNQTLCLPINVAINSTVSTPVQGQGLLSGNPGIITNIAFGVADTAAGAIGCVYAHMADGRILAWGNKAIDGVSAILNTNNPVVFAIPARAGSPTVTRIAAIGKKVSSSMVPSSIYETQLAILFSDGVTLVAGGDMPTGAISDNTVAVPSWCFSFALAEPWMTP